MSAVGNGADIRYPWRDLDESEGRTFIAMELLEGQTARRDNWCKTSAADQGTEIQIRVPARLAYARFSRLGQWRVSTRAVRHRLDRFNPRLF